MKRSFIWLSLFCFWYPAAQAQNTKEYHLPVGNGINLFVKEMGDSKKTTILFLHGGAGDNHLNFMPHFNVLASQYHLVFYDQTDAGKSYSAQKPTYSIALEIENLEKIRQHLKVEKLDLIGHSWGSILALSYAEAYPQHIDKILLTGSIGTDASFYQLFASHLLKKLTQQDYARMQQLVTQGASRQDIHEKLMLRHYFADSANIHKMTKTKINFEVNQSIAMNISTQFNLKGKLERFNFPVLVVQGKQDLLTVQEIKAGFTGMPNISFVEMENAGHWAFVEQPEEFRKRVNNFFSK